MKVEPPAEAAIILIDGPVPFQIARVWTDTTKPNVADMTRMQRLVFATRLREIAQDLEMYDLLPQPMRPIPRECSE